MNEIDRKALAIVEQSFALLGKAIDLRKAQDEREEVRQLDARGAAELEAWRKLAVNPQKCAEFQIKMSASASPLLAGPGVAEFLLALAQAEVDSGNALAAERVTAANLLDVQGKLSAEHDRRGAELVSRREELREARDAADGYRITAAHWKARAESAESIAGAPVFGAGDKIIGRVKPDATVSPHAAIYAGVHGWICPRDFGGPGKCGAFNGERTGPVRFCLSCGAAKP